MANQLFQLHLTVLLCSSGHMSKNHSSPRCTECKGEKIVPKTPLDHQSDWVCESCSFQLNWEEMVNIEKTAKNLVKEMTSQAMRFVQKTVR